MYVIYFITVFLIICDGLLNEMSLYVLYGFKDIYCNILEFIYDQIWIFLITSKVHVLSF